ncbi:leucine-rich repeat and IQ domain-containing protein 3-like [Heptranchias perlo]|uniref:leucine-rich repeat and IQ domain-containing protein 3-like n=1 Tax=Heptranchias perlo TaxID=212740 RepID=UPI003559F621
MKRLVDNSHLVSPSKSLILLHGEMDRIYKEKKLEEIVVVNLSRHCLINLGYLTNCPALRICILSKNYITKIDALAFCPDLIKLDLHGNHITDLPDEWFWSDMKCLQLLYLHDNIIGQLKSIEPLFSCPSLIALTLFDTPVSLIPNYRHYIINNMMPLKALDNFIIADEEIIEDWPKSDTFKALSPNFFIDLPASPQISTLRSEMKQIRNLISTMNNILAHYSPLLILQRWIRGYLTRKKLRVISIPRQKHLPCQQVNAELCSQGIHVLEDGSLWDRCEANELTSGIYPRISQWSRWNTPNFKPQKSTIFRHRTFRQPRFAPRPGIFELDSSQDEEEQEEEAEKNINEGLVLHPIIHQPEHARDMLLCRRAAGNDVRLGIQQLHEMLRKKPQPKVTYRPPVSLDKRLYAKSYGCMSLAPFMAIQKAYGDREKAVKQRLRADLVRKPKAAEEQAGDNVHGQALKRSHDPLQKYKEDKVRSKGVLLQRKIDQEESLKVVRQSHVLFLEEKNRRGLEHQVAKEFNSRYTMMSEALLKRQIRAKNENIHQQNLDLVQLIRKQAKQQKEEIRDFMTYKQSVMQAENNAARTTTNTILSQAAKDRLLHARTRVAAQKTRHHSTETTDGATPEQTATYQQKLPDISPQI